MLIRFSFILLLVILLSIFYFSVTYNDQAAGFASDDAIYLLMAEMYSPWISNSNPVLDFIRPEYQFPPLYPVLLGFMGVNSSTPELATTITTFFLLNSIFIYGLWVWRETGRYLPTIALPLLFALLPSTIIMSQELWSEFLFMCFTYGAFLCLCHKHATDKQWFLSALLVALASLTRSLGITVITAYCLILCINRPGKEYKLVLISALPFLIWTLIRKYVSGKSGYFNEVINSINGVDGLTHYFSEHLAGQPLIFADAWRWLFIVNSYDNDLKPVAILLSVIIFLFFLTGFWVRLRQKKIDAIALPLYLFVVVLWPYTGTYFVSRFLFPLLPLFIFYNWISVEFFIKSTSKQNIVFALCLIFIGILAYPATSTFIEKAYSSIEPEYMPYRHNRASFLEKSIQATRDEAIRTKEITDVFKKLKQYIPKQDCIYALQAPAVMLHAQRIAEMLPPPEVPDDEFKKEILRCRYILATFFYDIDGIYPPFYPMYRIPDTPEYKTTPFMTKYHETEKPVAFLVEQLSFN